MIKLSTIFKYLTAQNYNFYFWGAVAGAVVGGLIGAKGAKSAAEAGAAGQAAATAEQRRQFDITQEQYAPWLAAGQRGLSQYESMLGGYGAAESMIPSNLPGAFSFTGEDFQQYKDPGYEFRVEEGLRALDRRMAAGGKRGAGVRPRGLMELGQNLASQEFGAARGRAYEDYSSRVARESEVYGRGLEQYGRQYVDPMNRYASLANVGQTMTAGLGGQRATYAQNVGQNLANIGGYQAAGTLGQYGAYAGMIGGVGQALKGMNWGGAPQANNMGMSYEDW